MPDISSPVTTTSNSSPIDESFILLIVFIVLTIAFISGGLSRRLHYLKGYKGGFAIGFFLGIIGLIYSAGLPDNLSKEQREENERIEEENKKYNLFH